MAVDLKSLVGKLNDPCRKALEDAAGLTMSRTNYNVEIEHWLLKLMDIKDGDISKILSRYEADTGRLTGDLNRAIERFKTGNGRPPGLSPQVVGLAREAWLFASVNRQAHQVRSGHILVAMLSDETMSIAARNASAQLAKIPVETLARDFEAVTDGSSEAKAAEAVADVQSGAAAAGAAPRKGASGALDLYTTDLTARAKAGKLDPVLGRDNEIRQCIDILLRRRQNNPILTGEAGVGKTSVVDGLALKIAAGDVPEKLKNCAIRVLDLGLLQAGAGMKGEFENRLNSVLQDVKASPQPIIMF
ncbi:MAG: type VI secretion system ATPase TssH, partial [Alphaproteobacteria bacterium]|nr:type VI secretion system ATPase TssH [Alphaproteobacteria bacterium]